MPDARLYYSDDLVELWHGDSREVSAWLTADVLVTDPPYGRNWRQGETGTRQRRASDKHAGIAGDKDTSTRDAILEAWGADRPAVAFGDLMLAPPAGTKQVLVYRKANDAGSKGAFGGFRRDLESVYLIGPWRAGLNGRSSVIATSASMQAGAHGLTGRYQHPHAKPQDVMETLLGVCPPGVIADPFAGSGSTLVAARNLGRRAIGVEIDEQYCKLIVGRLAQGALNLSLAP